MSTVLTQVGLLATAMTAFCTTVAPVDSILPYTGRKPYVLLIISVGLCIGGLVAGGTMVCAIYVATDKWFREVRTPRPSLSKRSNLFYRGD